MARVQILPDADVVGVVDPRLLLEAHGGAAPPPAQAPTAGGAGPVRQLRSFVVSQDPRISVVPHFLSQSECEHLVELAEGHWTRSLVGSLQKEEEDPGVDRKLFTRQAQTRTSSSCMLRPSQTATVERIEHRLASLSKLPLDTLERLVVVRYAAGEEFSEHHDGKFRPKTVFVYLNDLPEGGEGETFFMHLGLSFVPRAGCAVMWTNATPEGTEDSRMIHAGRPPAFGIKYGINCFFNDDRMRLTYGLTDLPDTVAWPESQIDVRALLESAEFGPPAEGVVRTFVLSSEPRMLAVPSFATAAEVEHLLALAAEVEPATAAAVAGGEGVGTLLLRLLQPAETSTIERLEERLATVTCFPLEHLGPMRLVRSGTAVGSCNRGCGQRSALLCLARQDEVCFPFLRLRLKLCQGDLLFWPNAWWSEPVSDEPGSRKRVVEDLRTVRYHELLEEGSSAGALALDASFHDTPIRSQQREMQLAEMRQRQLLQQQHTATNPA